MAIPNREKVLSHVMRWVVQSGLTLESVSDENFDFALTISEKKNLPELQIIHRNSETAFVIVAGLVKIPKNDREKLKEILKENFDQLIWDIKIRLLSMNVDFIVWGPEKDPDSWEVQKHVFLEETNTTSFYEAYQQVKNAIICIIWSYKQKLPQTS